MLNCATLWGWKIGRAQADGFGPGVWPLQRYLRPGSSTARRDSQVSNSDPAPSMSEYAARPDLHGPAKGRLAQIFGRVLGHEVLHTSVSGDCSRDFTANQYQ